MSPNLCALVIDDFNMNIQDEFIWYTLFADNVILKDKTRIEIRY